MSVLLVIVEGFTNTERWQGVISLRFVMSGMTRYALVLGLTIKNRSGTHRANAAKHDTHTTPV